VDEGACYDNIFDQCRVPLYKSSKFEQFESEKAHEEVISWCGGDEECLKAGTRWTQVWQVNAWFMLIHCANFVLLAIGGFWFYPRVIGTFLNWLMSLCHVGVIAFTLFGRYNPFGNWCSYNIVNNNGWLIEDLVEQSEDVEDMHSFTYKADASLLSIMAFSQLTFVVLNICLFSQVLARTPMKLEDKQVQEQHLYSEKYSGVAQPGMLHTDKKIGGKYHQ